MPRLRQSFRQGQVDPAWIPKSKIRSLEVDGFVPPFDKIGVSLHSSANLFYPAAEIAPLHDHLITNVGRRRVDTAHREDAAKIIAVDRTG